MQAIKSFLMDFICKGYDVRNDASDDDANAISF